jgi:hypothetical protein
MTSPGNFIITVIAITLGLITLAVYILLNVEPNIFWLIDFIILVGIIATMIASLVIYSFSKLRSFETPRQLYRRKFKWAAFVGVFMIVLLLAQKFFNIL